MNTIHSPALINLVRKLFGQADEEIKSIMPGMATEGATPVPETHGEESQFVEHQQAFESRLQGFLTRHNGSANVFAGGRVHLINIDEVRARLGKKWPKMANRIHELIQDTLKVRLSQQDFFTRQGESIYIIVFGNSSVNEAKLKCALLAEEIMEKIFGQERAQQIEILGVQTVVTGIDGSIETEGITRTDALANVLKDMAEKEAARSTTEVRTGHAKAPLRNGALSITEVTDLLGTAKAELRAHQDGINPQGGADQTVDRLQELLRQLRNFEKALVGAALTWSRLKQDEPRAKAVIEWQTQATSAKDKLHQLILRTQEEISQRRRQFSTIQPTDEDESEGGGKGEESGLPLNAEISFLPMWHASRAALGLHLCQLSLDYRGERLSYRSIIKDNMNPEVAAIIDKILLRKAIKQLWEADSIGTANIIGIPVHHSTLEKIGSQREFLRICHAIPQELRDTVIWEIVNASLAAWPSRLSMSVAALKPFGRAVFLRVDLSHIRLPDLIQNLKYLPPAGVQAVGFDVTAISSSLQPRILDLLEQFAASAKKHGLKCYAHGLGSMSVVTAAICAGLDHISGQAVAEETDTLKGISPMTAEALYLQSLEPGHTSGNQAFSPEKR